MTAHEKIKYVEFPTKDMNASKTFFTTVFGWEFTDYGPDYMSFENAGVSGGFYRADLSAKTDNGSALVVLFSDQLEETLAKIEAAGGEVTKPIIEFPGGRRFQFAEPCGNELAVWSDKTATGEIIP